jgi:hypothetical protein
MKKIIMILAIISSSIGVFASGDSVNPKVLNAFNSDFRSAKEVEWTVANNYYKATFTFNEQHVFAYYNADGELLGLTRYISSASLPISLQSSLKKNYADYWISDLFEVAKDDGTAYYITLENADTKLVLKASGNNWSPYQKIRKA